jgi:PPP family 3-phenylpropionic acid transporter
MSGFRVLQLATPERRTMLYYFVNYSSSGAAVAYAGIWFANQGLNSTQIGVINSLSVFLMLGLNLAVGRIADRAKDWRQVIIVGALLSAAFPFGLFIAHGFLPILIVWTCIAVPVAAIAPVADAASLRLTRRNGTEFGTIRAFGTVGYMVFNALTGVAVSLFSGVVFIPLYVAVNLARGAMALGLPKFRAPPVAETVAAIAGPPMAGRLREVMKPWFVLPILGAAIIFATHAIINAFAALVWKEQGIPDVAIGALIAVGAFAEATMMFTWRKVGARFSARATLLVSALAAVVRWTAMGFSPPVWILVFLQLLQSLSFALGYLGAVHFIAKWTSEDIAAECQSFFVVLQQVATVIIVSGFGWLTGFMGAQAFFVAAAFALIGAACIWLSMRLKQPQAS